MSYTCLDCGNRSSKQFPGGRCPACDSFNIKSKRKKDSGVETEKPSSNVQRFLLVFLWILVAYGVWKNYM